MSTGMGEHARGPRARRARADGAGRAPLDVAAAPDVDPARDSLTALRRRWPIVALLTFVTVAVALALALTATKKYDAVARLLLRDQIPIDTLLAPNTSGTDDPERDINTGVELIKVGGTAHEVRRRLRLPLTTDQLLEKVSTESHSDSDVVGLRVRDRDPRRATAIANAFAEAYVDFRVSNARDRYTRAADLAHSQLLGLSAADRLTPQGRELQARERQLQIAAALQTGGAQIVRRASVPKHASRPRPLLSVALGGLLGVLLGIGTAFALERLDRRLRSERDVEGLFSLPILASIPRASRRHADRAQREAFGLLAANLRYATPDAEYQRVLLVTSASPAEGKTSVTLGTARALARLGLRVIAVEADLRRPTFADRAQVDTSVGLAGVLSGKGTLSDALVWLDPTTFEHVPPQAPGSATGSLALLPAGDLPAQPGRVLSSEAMSALVALTRDRADVVIIDTAPLGTVNDAVALLPNVDGLMLVARLNHTSKDAVRRAMRVLRGIDVPIAGVVVSDAGAMHDYEYYGVSEPAVVAPYPGQEDDRT